MTGTIRVISIIFLTLILSGCMKTTCVSHNVWTTKCEKKVDWNNPGFTVVRTIITQGANVGN
jgi:PBP1b-binding outer membrane lipoprotein LpoB